MVFIPVVSDIFPPTHPHLRPFALDVIQELGQGGSTSRASDQSAMQADGQHFGIALPSLLSGIERAIGRRAGGGRDVLRSCVP